MMFPRFRPGDSKTLRDAAWLAGERLHRSRLFGGGTPALPSTPADGSLWDDYGQPWATPTPSPGPFSLVPGRGVVNPVITAADVTDFGDADFVADPFLFVTPDGRWHLFFEVFNRDRTPTAAIAHAESDDGKHWTYNRVVLETNDHLAFPYLFEFEDHYYMLPERWDRETPASALLYRTESLPYGWSPVAELVTPDRFLSDFVVFRHDGRWWALAGSDDDDADLFAFYSDELEADDWTPHDANPVVEGRPKAARPGGRPLVRDDDIVVFLQDCEARYGNRLRGYVIDELTPSTYRDRELRSSPILEGTGTRFGWNSGRMHHLDPWPVGDGWRCAVDGNIEFGGRVFGADHWAIGIYESL
ncbi:hypothetical protein AUR64_07495 [Haloprofundus marisrubri]|uniref:Glucosamine inositolphosphorylceramide transferase 1 N-terminal domain-containing protein n=1 Tax=Haloprofundus marisrubri TaxID=1514971 RepID=A0A0W1RC97_9EURY|nr:hypothetical protein [Haloprofundus marisrubri]KTG11002.1 hypothetical protein AUR64_07495 [Haloprofundus marisrubri]